EPFTIQWAFGDGTSGSGVAGVPVLHQYLTGGDFRPSVTVTDGAGPRYDQTFVPIHVASPPSRPATFFGPVPTNLFWPGIVLAVAGFGAIVATLRLMQVRRW